MDEKNIMKLWHVCSMIQDFCEGHNNCEFCPFHDYWNNCMIKNAADVPAEELWKLFPENIVSEDD